MSSEKSMDLNGNATGPRPDDLRLVRGLIRYHQAMGIAEYPLNAPVRRFMELTEDNPAGRTQKKGKPSVRRPVSEAEHARSAGTALASLRREMEHCTRCHLASGRRGMVPGTGGVGCRLMVVGDWSAQTGGFSGEVLFGPEEDVMLWKMMAAIGLGPAEVYVTNCVKCCPEGADEPDSASGTSCFFFLSREIALLRPAVICAMGEIASRLLTGGKAPLYRLRGRFATYSGDSAVPAAVMPTFHPRFLLANPEMKKAAWSDLQAIKRRLDGLSR